MKQKSETVNTYIKNIKKLFADQKKKKWDITKFICEAYEKGYIDGANYVAKVYKLNIKLK